MPIRVRRRLRCRTIQKGVSWVVVLPDLFRGMGAWRNFTETQQSDHAPRYGPEVKNGSSAEDGAPERLRCRTIQEASQILQRVSAGAAKNSPSVLYCIGKRTREGCDRGSEVGTAHSGWDGEGPVPPRKPKESGRGGCCEKKFVSTKSSCLIFAVVGASGQGTWVKGNVAPVLASESAHSFPGSPAWPGAGTYWKFRATREERESERYQISQKDFGWRNAGSVERRVRADWESVRKRADWKWHDFRWEWHHSRPCTSARDSAEKLEETGPAE